MKIDVKHPSVFVSRDGKEVHLPKGENTVTKDEGDNLIKRKLAVEVVEEKKAPATKKTAAKTTAKKEADDAEKDDTK